MTRTNSKQDSGCQLLCPLVVGVGVLLFVGCRPAESPRAETSTARPPSHDLLVETRGDLVDEFWEAHSFQGAKVGHRHVQVYQLDQFQPPLFRIVAVDELETRRFGDVARQVLRTVSLETADGIVRQLAYEVVTGDTRRERHGWVHDGYLELDNGDGRNATRLNWSERQGGVFAIERSLQRQPLQAGESREIEAFLPLLDRVVRFQLNAGQPEAVRLEGETRELLRIEAVDQLADSWQLPTVYWMDDQGAILKTQEPFLDRQTVRTSQMLAKRPNDVLGPDLGVDTGVKVAEPIEFPAATYYAVYRIQIEGLRPETVFPGGQTQQLRMEPDGTAMLTVQRLTVDSPLNPDIAVTPPTPDDLAANAMIQSDHRNVVALADAAAGSVEDPWEAAKLLERYLFLVLSKVDYSQVFSSAAEVAARKAGDCSEHAVLLAAACRARGIPARVAVGLLYSAEDQSFLYHMWNEVWINDRWIPLDATFGQGGIGACHLKFRDSSLARQNAYSMVSPVIHLIGRLKIDVISTEFEVD